MQWKHEITKLVELLLTTKDLKTVQSLTVQLQRVLYLHIEQIQRESVEANSAYPNDSSVIEIGLSNRSGLPKPIERP